MSIINKGLQGMLFNGTDLDLASASWKGKVSAIYGFNAAGNGYTVFKPASAFNSLTKLVQDGAYIVAASTPGFELPGAVLSALTKQSVPVTFVAPVINTLTIKPSDDGIATVVANVTGADSIKVFANSIAQVEAGLIEGQDNVIATGVDYSAIDSGQVSLQLLKAGTVVLTYSFWIHD
jgi:hypothetical protein